MKVVAFNAGSAGRTTSQLAQEALEGAASQGADTEMVMLAEQDIRFCRNCLTCYQDLDSTIAPCPQDDDMPGLLEKIRQADGLIFASPVHAGFVNGLMTTFLERCIWTLCRPTGEIMGLKGAPLPRLQDKPRAVASIMSAGLVPEQMRQYCDAGTPWVLETAVMIANGTAVGDLYAAASFAQPVPDDQWKRALLLRRLSQDQLQKAHDLGAGLAQALAQGKVAPFDPAALG